MFNSEELLSESDEQVTGSDEKQVLFDEFLLLKRHSMVNEPLSREEKDGDELVQEEAQEGEEFDVDQAIDDLALCRDLAEIDTSKDRAFELSQRHPRLFEVSVELQSVQNLSEGSKRIFLDVNYSGPVSKIVATQRTGALALGPRATLAFQQSLPLVPNQFVIMSYQDLAKTHMMIDAWQMSTWTFNTLIGGASVNLRHRIKATSSSTLALASSEGNLEIAVGLNVVIEEVTKYHLTLDRSMLVTDSQAGLQTLRGGPLTLNLVLDASYKVPKQVVSAKHEGTRQSQLSFSAFGVIDFCGTPSAMQDQVLRLTVSKSGMPVAHGMTSLHAMASGAGYTVTMKQLGADSDSLVVGVLFGRLSCIQTTMPEPALVCSSETKLLPQPPSPYSDASRLNLNLRYLVVRVLSSSDLPLVDLTQVETNAYVTVDWDSRSKRTGTQRRTLAPEFNENLFFPIHYLCAEQKDQPIRSKIGVELAGRGPIMLRVWHEGATKMDHIGTVEVPFEDIFLSSRSKMQSRCLLEGMECSDAIQHLQGDRPVIFTAIDEHDEEQTTGQLGSADRKRIERRPFNGPVYDGRDSIIQRSAVNFASSNPAFIHFEIYVAPPFSSAVQWERPAKKPRSSWAALKNSWSEYFQAFQDTYRSFFPQAPIRCFNPTFSMPGALGHSKDAMRPLSSLITPILLPLELSQPAALLNWSSSFGWSSNDGPVESELTPRALEALYDQQSSTARPLSIFLARRRGSLADHVHLLCASLIGMSVDAYVIRGQDWQDQMYFAVLVRHQRSTSGVKGSWVEVWEVRNKLRYAMPGRWQWGEEEWAELGTAKYDPSQSAAGIGADGETVQADEDFVDPLNKLHDYQLDHAAKSDKQTPEQNYRVDRNALSMQFASVESQEHSEDSESSEAWEFPARECESDRLLLLPRKYTQDWANTMAYLPYKTVDIIYNNVNVWANMQNANPASVCFDFESAHMWKPLLKTECEPLDRELSIAKPFSQTESEELQREIKQTVYNSLRAVRFPASLESRYAQIPEVEQTRIGKFLELLESREHLDFNADPGPPEHQTSWSAWAGSTLGSGLYFLDKNNYRRWHINREAELADSRRAQRESESALHEKFDAALSLAEVVPREVAFREMPVIGAARFRDESYPGMMQAFEVDSAESFGNDEQDEWELLRANRTMDVLSEELSSTGDANEDSKSTSEEEDDRTDQTGKFRPPFRWTLDDGNEKYLKESRKGWKQYYEAEQAFYDWLNCQYTPGTHNTVGITGYPIRLLSPDTKDVVNQLTENHRFRALREQRSTSAFVIEVRVFAYWAQTSSVWLFLGLAE